jgi:transposase InsO family protein
MSGTSRGHRELDAPTRPVIHGRAIRSHLHDRIGGIPHIFAADRPNQLWLTDISEHKTAEGKIYLCAVKDMFWNRIVGYSIDSRMKSRLAVNAMSALFESESVFAR